MNQKTTNQDINKLDASDIRSIREKVRMSRPEFCKVIFDLPLRTLENWESGVRKPPEYVINLIIFRLEQLGLM